MLHTTTTITTTAKKTWKHSNCPATYGFRNPVWYAMSTYIKFWHILQIHRSNLKMLCQVKSIKIKRKECCYLILLMIRKNIAKFEEMRAERRTPWLWQRDKEVFVVSTFRIILLVRISANMLGLSA